LSCKFTIVNLKIYKAHFPLSPPNDVLNISSLSHTSSSFQKFQHHSVDSFDLRPNNTQHHSHPTKSYTYNANPSPSTMSSETSNNQQRKRCASEPPDYVPGVETRAMKRVRVEGEFSMTTPAPNNEDLKKKRKWDGVEETRTFKRPRSVNPKMLVPGKLKPKAPKSTGTFGSSGFGQSTKTAGTFGAPGFRQSTKAAGTFGSGFRSTGFGQSTKAAGTFGGSSSAFTAFSNAPTGFGTFSQAATSPSASLFTPTELVKFEAPASFTLKGKLVKGKFVDENERVQPPSDDESEAEGETAAAPAGPSRPSSAKPIHAPLKGKLKIIKGKAVFVKEKKRANRRAQQGSETPPPEEELEEEKEFPVVFAEPSKIPRPGHHLRGKLVNMKNGKLAFVPDVGEQPEWTGESWEQPPSEDEAEAPKAVQKKPRTWPAPRTKTLEEKLDALEVAE
jgi:hypothetical protein